MKKILTAIFMLAYATVALPSLASEPPDCSGIDGRKAAIIAFGFMKYANVIDTIAWHKTKTIRLASEEVGIDIHGNKELNEEEYVHRQVHWIKYTEKSGNVIEVITVNEASNMRCSVGGIDVFIISQRLGTKRFGLDDP